MTSHEAKELCLGLIKANTEEEVIRLLKQTGFWDDPNYWRYYGDRESNFNTIGNQQSRPDAALVEKIVNSVDARLMNECLVRGMSPEGSDVPLTVRDAVAVFFENEKKADSVRDGRIKNWLDAKRTEIARGITLVATGAAARSGNPCFTISDFGEGQTPEKIPFTLLSLDRTNKLRIPFVQGKFNMGGTGVLQFCGRHNLQLVVSRRNPEILKVSGMAHSTDNQWGFTVVRREDPGEGRRSSVYTYLAPMDCESIPGKGGVLRFSAEEMPIFPEGREPYKRTCKWGTLIKLYEYAATGYKTHILRRDGLLSRIDLLLPEVALPVRLHECRPTYKGHAGSFETTLAGISVRLDDDKGENLETGFPSSCSLSSAGEQMIATIYAFKKGKSDTYRKNEGIIFIINGQTHGHLTIDFFSRKTVGMSYLSDSIFVIADCSQISGRAREDLFMNSRDRLRGGDLRAEIEDALEDLLRNHQGLRDLRERRRREEIESRLEEEKPLEEILESLLKSSPTLSVLFLAGNRLSNPFKTTKVHSQEKDFRGKQHPTFFKFKDKEYGTVLQRQCHGNMRCRVIFETDVVNDYFSRREMPGEFELTYSTNGGADAPVSDYVVNLQHGIATLSVVLPTGANDGDEIRFTSKVADETLVEPFMNIFNVKILAPLETKGGKGKRRKPPSDEEGTDRELPIGIQLPKIKRVYENEWNRYDFDKYSALRVKHAGDADEGNGDKSNQSGKAVYDFFINMDNIYLKTESKARSEDNEIIKGRFIYGLVLIGLALLHEDAQAEEKVAKTNEEKERDTEESKNIEEKVFELSKALAPVLLPMIESLSGLTVDEMPTADVSGEAT